MESKIKDLRQQLFNFKLNKSLKSRIRILNFKRPINIKYPFKKTSSDIKIFSLDKINNEIFGHLLGIKGQYLIFEDSTVFNISSKEGLRVEINIE